MIVSLLGLPGVGKSTLAGALGRAMDGAVLAEPEESAWPDFVKRPHPLGDFTRLSWFRSQRVPLYYAADAIRRRGKVAVLDSYYDKWCGGWLGKPGLEWLISPDDPYFPVAMTIAELDAKLLPSADVVVVLEITEDLWFAQVQGRGRTIDRHDPFLQSHHTQELFVNTALERAAGDGTRVIRHRREALPPREEATLIAEKIRQVRAMSGLREGGDDGGAESDGDRGP